MEGGIWGQKKHRQTHLLKTNQYKWGGLTVKKTATRKWYAIMESVSPGGTLSKVREEEHGGKKRKEAERKKGVRHPGDRQVSY